MGYEAKGGHGPEGLLPEEPDPDVFRFGEDGRMYVHGLEVVPASILGDLYSAAREAERSHLSGYVLARTFRWKP